MLGYHINNEDNDEDEDYDEMDERNQIKVLRSHAKVLENLNDFNAAEVLHQRALELDPTNIITLEQYAIFLNHKRGELLRAEAFFNRGLQICLPGMNIKSSMNSPIYDIILKQSDQKQDLKLSSSIYKSIIYDSNPSINNKNHKIKHIIRFILSYANFLNKSKGNH